MLPDRYFTGERYRGILRNNLVPFVRQHFGDNCRYQDDNATPHQHIWDGLGHAITSRDNPPQNLSDLLQALVDKWAEILAERLQHLVASNALRRVSQLGAGKPDIDPTYTEPHQQAASCKKIKFV